MSGNAQRLSPSLRDALVGLLQQQIERCYSAPPGAAQGVILPVLDIRLNPDGSLNSEPRIMRGGSSSVDQSIAQAALRGAALCALSHPGDLRAVLQRLEGDQRGVRVHGDVDSPRRRPPPPVRITTEPMTDSPNRRHRAPLRASLLALLALVAAAFGLAGPRRRSCSCGSAAAASSPCRSPSPSSAATPASAVSSPASSPRPAPVGLLRAPRPGEVPGEPAFDAAPNFEKWRATGVQGLVTAASPGMPGGGSRSSSACGT